MARRIADENDKSVMSRDKLEHDFIAEAEYVFYFMDFYVLTGILIKKFPSLILFCYIFFVHSAYSTRSSNSKLEKAAMLHGCGRDFIGEREYEDALLILAQAEVLRLISVFIFSWVLSVA